jgi:hypothetical protein
VGDLASTRGSEQLAAKPFEFDLRRAPRSQRPNKVSIGGDVSG